MGIDILQIFRFGAVDVAREIEVAIVLGAADLRDWNESGIAGNFCLPRERLDDAMNVLLAETVFIAVLHTRNKRFGRAKLQTSGVSPQNESAFYPSLDLSVHNRPKTGHSR